MDNYLTLKDTEATINEWQARAERAEKACVEMRAIISGDIQRICYDVKQGGVLGECLQDAIDKALFTSCGKDYVRREELDAAKAENAKLLEALRFAANSYREMATDEALSQTLYEVANIAKQALGKEGE